MELGPEFFMADLRPLHNSIRALHNVLPPQSLSKFAIHVYFRN